MRTLAAILAVLLVAVHYRIWAHADGLAGVWRLERAVEAQRAENAALRARNERLLAEVRDLKEGRDAVEERARLELGMIHEDETFYHVVDR